MELPLKINLSLTPGDARALDCEQGVIPGYDFFKYDTKPIDGFVEAHVEVDAKRLVKDQAYYNAFKKFATCVVDGFQNKSSRSGKPTTRYQNYKNPVNADDLDLTTLADFLDNFNLEEATEKNHLSIYSLGNAAFLDKTKYPNPELFYKDTGKTVTVDGHKVPLYKFTFDLKRYYTDAAYNKKMYGFLSAYKNNTANAADWYAHTSLYELAIALTQVPAQTFITMPPDSKRRLARPSLPIVPQLESPKAPIAKVDPPKPEQPKPPVVKAPEPKPEPKLVAKPEAKIVPQPEPKVAAPIADEPHPDAPLSKLPNNSSGIRGDQFFAEGSYNDAAKEYSTAIVMTHNKPDQTRSLTLRRCEAYLRAGKLDKASADATEVINDLELEKTQHKLSKQQNLDLAKAYYLRSRIFKIRGTGKYFNDAQMLSSAGSDLKKAQELNPEYMKK